MREKLLDLMKNEGLKPSQLAELLGINPAGISHILAGRNKPGFDLLQKILRRFPRINPDWLLLDSDKMYRDEPPAQSSAPQPMSQPASPGGDLFGLASGRHPLEEKRQPETAEGALSVYGTVSVEDFIAAVDTPIHRPRTVVVGVYDGLDDARALGRDIGYVEGAVAAALRNIQQREFRSARVSLHAERGVVAVRVVALELECRDETPPFEV